LFTNPEQFDFHLLPGSLAEKIGFQPSDPSQAGL